MARTLKTILTLDMRNFRRGMKRVGASVKKFNRQISRPLGKAIAKLGRMAVMAGIAAAAIGAAGLRISGEMEQAKLRLELMSNGIDDFRKSWKEVNRLFIRSPLELEPLIRAKTLMKSLGITGPSALKSIAAAAVAMGREVDDVVLALGSMRALPLRRLGIDARKAGDAFTFAFRDKAGKQLKFTARGLEEARRQVIKIFAIKFGGGLERMAKTWAGAMSTFRGVRKQSIADLFEPLKQRALPALLKMNDALISMIESGRLKEIGTQISGAVTKVVTKTATAVRAIVRLNRATGGGLLKVAAIFGTVALAFKLNLVIPLLRLSAMLVKGFVATLISPLGAALAALALIFASFKLGKVLEETFDVSTFVLRGLEVLKGFGKKIGAFFASIGPDFERNFNAFVEMIDKDTQAALDKIGDPKGKGTFMENLKKEMEATVADAKRIGGKIADALLPAAFKDFIGDLGDTFKLPELNIKVPELDRAVAGGAERGVRSGLLRQKFGKLFTGEIAGPEARLSGTRDRRTQEKQLVAQQSTVKVLMDLRDRGVLVF